MQCCLSGRWRVAAASRPFESQGYLVSTSRALQRLRTVPQSDRKRSQAGPPTQKRTQPTEIFSASDFRSLLRPDRNRSQVNLPLSISRIQPYPNHDLSTTHPAPLELPPKLQPSEPGQSLPLSTRARYLFNIGKAYLRLYKTGLVNVWRNSQELRTSLRPKVRPKIHLPVTHRSERLDFLVRHSGQVHPAKPSSSTPSSPQSLPNVTRRDYHFTLRTERDLLKLPVFALILTIFGEFTPLLILLLGSRVVPGTCVIPRQADADWKALLSRVDHFTTTWTGLRHDQSTAAAAPNQDGQVLAVKKHHAQAYLLGLTRLPQPASGPFFLSGIFYRLRTLPRLRRRLHHVLNDALLTAREGGYTRLPPAEVLECVRLYPLPETAGIVRQFRDRNGGRVEASEELKSALEPILEREGRRLVGLLKGL